MINQTNFFFDEKYIVNFYQHELKAKTYNKPFSKIDKFYLMGDFLNPLGTIPKELQVFPDPVIYIYILDIPETLEWHIDEMRMDYLASAKYTALIEGSGTLESKVNGEIYTFDFNKDNRYKWVLFQHTLPHRFVPKEKTKMVMAVTAEQNLAENFNKSYFWSTEVDAINKTVWKQQSK